MSTLVDGKIISFIFDKVDEVGANLVASTYKSLSSQYSTLFLTLAGIYLGFWFLQAKRGNYSLNDFPVVVLRVVVILTLSLNYHYFYLFLYDVFTNQPLHILKAITIKEGTISSTSISDSLNYFLNQGQDQASKLFGMGSWNNFTYYLFGGVLFVMVLLAAGIAASVIILAKCVSAILLALAPLFIFCALFDSTKGLFDSYLGQLITYALMPILTASILMIVLSVSDVALTAMKEENLLDFYSIMPLCLICMIQIYLLLQVKNQCAALSGGFALPQVMSTLKNTGSNLSTAASGLAKSSAKLGSLIFNGPSSLSPNKSNASLGSRSHSMSFNNRFQTSSPSKQKTESKPKEERKTNDSQSTK